LRVQRYGLPSGADLRVTVAYFDYRGVASVVDLNPIVAGTAQCYSHIGRVDFKGLVPPKIADVHNGHPGGDIHLRRAIVEVQEREAGHASKPDGRATDIELGA